MTNLPWWGTFDIPLGQHRDWRIGPLALRLEHRDLEWRVAWTHHDDPMDSTRQINDPSPVVDDAQPADESVVRFPASGRASGLTVTPVAADRPVVVRTSDPFHLPRGAQATFFASTPLWVRVSAGDQTLLEIPAWRPTDTWFGPNTLEGQLCYASRTLGRLRPEHLRQRPHRLMHTITVENEARSTLPIERMLLPVQHLAVWAREDGFLETSPVRMTHSADQDATFSVKRLAENHGGAPVGPARDALSGHRVVRAITSLFS